MTRGVLDDNPAMCHLLETLFSFAGHTVHAFTDPADFVASLYPNKIDDLRCTVVDFQLPGNTSGAEGSSSREKG